eukprot:CAMPEP_0180208194 /NCGR_PEP_ID=MMETSP0987-20121128/10609_1 /TAXON_ID=697907 /ORGANISM="non described non described, Strain CCMP2293" /LENGTH=56 /DNA_ID=CAMNT_0022164323 /DNA_START=113 /DNA_END=279 /DNA_ORIENTATION=+
MPPAASLCLRRAAVSPKLEPHTLHTQLSHTLHPKPYALHPKLNPQPSTLNPQPSTL